MRSATGLAAGVARLPDVRAGFSATQAAWRFLNNNTVGLPALIAPLRKEGIAAAGRSKAKFVLLLHDWCKLSFDHPRRKRDTRQITHATDVGYELSTALLVSGSDGRPLAPMEMELKTATGVLSTRRSTPHGRPHLEQVLPTMIASGEWGLNQPVLHVIDREADSVGHYRRWDAQGHTFLIRADDRRVRWNNQSILLSQVARELARHKQMKRCGTASYHGHPTPLWVAETEVTLHRPGRTYVRGQQIPQPGRALVLRFIVVEVRNSANDVLAQWMLLSNAPLSWATTETLARCYYWRWKIESFFKLLKSHGQQCEQWQQETGHAIARRLLIASMACVIVWQLQANLSPPAMEMKELLVRLSGRQTQRRNPHTAPALLAGLWVLLSMVSVLDHDHFSRIKRLAETFLPLSGK